MPSSHVCCMLCCKGGFRDGTAPFNSMLKIASGWKRETTPTFLLNSFEDVVRVTGHKEITCQRSSLWGQKDADDRERCLCAHTCTRVIACEDGLSG